MNSILSVDNIKPRNNNSDLNLLSSSTTSSDKAPLKIKTSGSVVVSTNLVIPTSAPGQNPPNGSIWLS